MREFISIVEARPKASVTVDPVVQAQRVYDQALQVAKTVGHALMIRSWNQEWVTAIKALVAKARQAHADNEADEAKYYGDEYQPQQFQLDVEEVSQMWWQRFVEPTLYDIESATKGEYQRYQQGHPEVELSDQMSLLQDEVRLAQNILLHGNDSLTGMAAILGALSSFITNIDHYRDIDYTNLATRETQDFVEKVMPAILTLCRLRGARPAT